ncbi:MAG TPA: PHP domain-containing protein [Longimicrobiales bacterium]
MRIDLHLHSNASDGSLSPSALVRAAMTARLDVIALTDHDTTAGYAEAEAVLKYGRPLVLVPGVEVSSTHAGVELHFLGYHIDPAHPAMLEHARSAAERRAERMRGMIERLARLGVRVACEDVRAAAGPGVAVLGRAHLARALVRLGYVRTSGEAFERFLADGGPAFIPTELLSPQEAIDLIHQAGGVAVWAHPPASIFEQEIRRFADWGLDGVECFRPRTAPEESRRLSQTARGLGLLVTGGSDWHGDWQGRLGEFYVDREDVEEFLAARGL